MKIPPFSKPLQQLILSGQVPDIFPDSTVYFYIGNKSWELGKNSSICRPTRTIVLPPGDPIHKYHYPVTNCDVMIIETSKQTEDFISNLAKTLFYFKADKVSIIYHDLYSANFKKEA